MTVTCGPGDSTHATSCIVCGSANWADMPVPGPRCMASDGRIVDAPLRRRMCRRCGLLTRQVMPELNGLFDRGYSLYAHAPAEGRERSRQAAYARWIADEVGSAPRSILDVGCGNGSLLQALAEPWPAALRFGCDPSAESVAHGEVTGARLWRGTAGHLPPSLSVDLVVSVNVIEHTDDPVAFLRDLSRALDPRGVLVVICPDGARPDVELLIADHVFSLTAPDLRAMLDRIDMTAGWWSTAPPPLGAFQMIVARRVAAASRDGGPQPVEGLMARRAAYLDAWRTLDERLLGRLPGAVTCFGTGESANLLRAYAPRVWSRVQACTSDDAAGAAPDALPFEPLGLAPHPLLLAVRPPDQPRVAGRLRAQGHRVVTWYDLVDEHVA